MVQRQDDSITVTAPAKINLFLHIMGQRPDGYHELESLFVFSEKGDEIQVRASDNLSLSVTGPFAPALNAVCVNEQQNIVYQAAQALQQAGGEPAGAAITLVKNLPIASGIGGGSADAAATLKALNKFWQLHISEQQLAATALSLGADVPACLHRTPLMVKGIGETVTATQLPKTYSVLLVNPNISLSTPIIFKAFHGAHGGGFMPSKPLPEIEDSPSFLSWLKTDTVNALQAPAQALCPEIISVLSMLEGCKGAELVRMSGSGATCFALFDTPALAEAAYLAVSRKNPEWWVQVDTIRAR